MMSMQCMSLKTTLLRLQVGTTLKSQTCRPKNLNAQLSCKNFLLDMWKSAQIGQTTAQDNIGYVTSVDVHFSSRCSSWTTTELAAWYSSPAWAPGPNENKHALTQFSTHKSHLHMPDTILQQLLTMCNSRAFSQHHCLSRWIAQELLNLNLTVAVVHTIHSISVMFMSCAILCLFLRIHIIMYNISIQYQFCGGAL